MDQTASLATPGDGRKVCEQRKETGLDSRRDNEAPSSPALTWRKIPGEILQLTKKTSGLTSKDKFALAIYKDLPWAPTDKTMAAMLGGGETENSALQTRAKLERLGYLRFETLGDRRRAIIQNLPEPPKGTHPNGIIISGLIMNKVHGFSNRIVAAIEIHLSGHRKIGWRAWKAGLLPITYLKAKERVSQRFIACLALQHCILNDPNLRKLYHPTLENYTTNLRKLYPISKDGIDSGIEVVSKDTTSEPTVRGQQFEDSPLIGSDKNLPYNKNKQTPPLKQENNMSLRIPYDTPADPVWLKTQKEIAARRQKTASAPRHNETRKKPKLLKYANKSYPAEYLEDMEWIKANCKLIHMSARGTQSFDNDIRIVRILDHGPSSAKGLRPGEINKILSQAVGKEWYGQKWNCPLSKDWCFKNFFDLRFSREARYEMYRRLNNLMSSEFGGKDKKIHLAEAMVSFYGHSFLMQVANVEPRRPRDQYPADLDEYRRQFNQALEIMPSTLSQSEKGKTAWNIRRLKKRYQEDFSKRLPDGYNANFYNEWPKFFNELVEFFDGRDAENIWPGWFNPDGSMVEGFLANAEFGLVRGGCRPPVYNKIREADCGW